MNKVKQIKNVYIWILAVLLPISLTSLAQEIAAPPVESVIDQHGVNLATGKFQLPGVDVGIGTSGSGLVRITNENSDNYAGKLYFGFTEMAGSGAGYLTMNASLSGQTYRFMVGGGMGSAAAPTSAYGPPYKQMGGGAAKLNCTGNYLQYFSGGSCTLTLGDGTEAIYGYSNSLASQSGRWFLQTITKPDGEVVSVTYHISSSQIKEIKSVSSSLGWMLKYEVDANYKVTKVTAINASQVYCDPNSSSCSVSSAYPNITATKSGSTTTIKRNGTTVLSYAENGNVITVTSPSGVTKTVTYNSSSNKVASVSIGGSTWNYSYSYNSTSGETTTTVTNPDLSSRSVKVGRFGVSYVGDEGTGISYTHHQGNGILEKSSTTLGPYTEYFYDDRGNVEREEVYPYGGGTPLTTTYEYPATCSNTKTCNKPDTITYPNGKITEYTYYSHGGVETETTYAVLGQPIEKRFYYTQYTPYIKNSSGAMIAQPPVWRLSSISTCMTAIGDACVGTEDERLTIQSYTGNNVLPYQTIVKRGNNTLLQITTLAHTIYGQLESVDGPKVGTVDKIYHFYDSLGRQTGTIGGDPDGTGARPRPAKKIKYDTAGRAYQVESGTATGTSSSNLTSMTVLSYTHQTFSSSTGLPIVTRHYDSSILVALSQTSYDNRMRPLCTAQRLNSAVYATIASTSACSLGTAGSGGNDRITRYTYTDDSKVESVISAYDTPLASEDFVREFNTSGMLDKEWDANGNLTQHYYDGFNRLYKTCYANPSNGASTNSMDCKEVEYDDEGLIDNVTLRDGQIIYYQYDLLGRVKGKTGAVSETIGYNNFNLITSHTNNGVTEGYIYNAIGWLLSHSQAAGSVGYEYYDHGTRKKLTYPGGFYINYGYNDGDELTSLTASSGGASFGFGYDNRSRRNSLTRSNSRNTTYGYNKHLLETINHSSVNNITLGYNQAMQINSKTNSVSTFNYDPALSAQQTYVNDDLNRITSVAGVSIGHSDGRGNITSDNSGSTYSYNAKNLLTSATVSGSTATLAYDAADRLRSITKSGTTTRFLYDGTDLIAEYNASGTLLRRYIHGPGVDEPLLWLEGSGTTDQRFLHADQQGSIIAVTNSSGSVLNRTAYDAFGNKTVSNATYESRFSFTGQVWLKEIGLYYYKARIYNQNLGRFMQTDPIGYADGMNWYAYVGNDPVNSRDPLGLNDCSTTRSNVPDYSGGCINDGETRTTAGCEGGDCTTYTGDAALRYAQYQIYGTNGNTAAGGEGPVMGMAPNPRMIVMAAIIGGKKSIEWTKKNIKNISFDGPETEKLSLYGKGRILQFRWKQDKFVLRLDLHPLSGSTDRILHINYGASKGSENNHFELLNAESILTWMGK